MFIESRFEGDSMPAQHQLARLAALFAFSFVAVTSSHATTVRGGSGYGIDNMTLCTSPSEPCEYSTPTTFDIGGTTYNGDLFTYNDGSGIVTLDVIETDATTFTLNLLNTSLDTGVLTCGTEGSPFSGGNSAVDSTGTTPVGVACMGGTSAETVTQTATATGFTFSNSGSADLVVYTVDGNIAGTTPVSEPSSLMLLGIGLAGLAGLAFKFR
jgi:hypothetical protein